MNKKLIESFTNPASDFRGAPFWAWNGKLEPEELKRQIRIMKKMGLGGFFMHSRVGLDTPYLSEKWFECVNACLDEAKEQDMNAWLYDEDRWPSGAAGGLVTKNPEFRARKLLMTELDAVKKLRTDKNSVAIFAVKINGSSATNARRLPLNKPAKLAKGETLLHFHVVVDESTPWYNNQTYLDTLNPKAVAEFIKVTHEKYKKEISKQFGKRVPGIFTDEPNHNHMLFGSIKDETSSVAWTSTIPTTFKKRYGYDLIEHLPEIFFDLDDSQSLRTRYNFHDCITFLFVDAFAKQIGEWCEKNNLSHTGHVLEEETLSSQVTVVGSCMRFYEHMQAPGMDLLTEHRREYDTAKQVSSVARQFDRKWRLTETYGCTGWDLPFAGHKALGDWQAALGINLRCQHLAWYTMLGEAKRDYPASIFQQSPWWESYEKVENHFARIHSVMTQGREVRELLVIHPNESMWTLCKKGWLNNDATENYNKMLVDLRDSLLSNNIDFDYGDEEIISRNAKIANKKGKNATFSLGKATYSAILVPPLITIRSTTLKILQQFKAAGGQVVFAGAPPSHVDALPSDAPAIFAADCDSAPKKGAKLARIVTDRARLISIKDDSDREISNTLHLLREDRENSYLFICNTSHSKSQKKEFKISKDPSMVRDRKTAYEKVLITGFENSLGTPLELDSNTGEIFTADAKRSKDGNWEITTSLPALGSRLFVIPKKKSSNSYPKRAKLEVAKTIKIKGEWDFTLSDDNVLVLDAPRFRIADAKWNPPTEILQIDHAIKDAIGVPHRGGQMVQPWARKKSANPAATKIELEYSFNVDTVPNGPFDLAIERPETFSIALNGHPINPDTECGHWCDKSLRRLNIDPAFIVKGRNIIKMICEYDENHSGLEIVYLLGSFGVSMRKNAITAITTLPNAMKIGDWTKQSLPFFAGSLNYRKTIKNTFNKKERLFVSLQGYAGIAARILVNGTEVGVLAWEPNEMDITKHVKSGETFELGIEILGHRRNSHGPLHHREKWTEWVGSGQFGELAGDITKYNLVPCGLTAEPQLLVVTQASHLFPPK